MAITTSNALGRITVEHSAIAQIARQACLECYGIVDLVSKDISSAIALLKNKKRTSGGVKVSTSYDRIMLELYVIIKYGVSQEAVSQSLKKMVKLAVEEFTGMVVGTIEVHIAGVKL